jgi:hypothetical protein
MVLEDSIEVRRGSTYEQVGEDRESKETDGCPLTLPPLQSAVSRRAKIARRLPGLL